MQLVDAPPREKVPPQNIEAETAVLGSMLIDEEAIPRGIEKLRPESFYHPPHRKIFQTIISLFEDNRAVDLFFRERWFCQEFFDPQRTRGGSHAF